MAELIADRLSTLTPLADDVLETQRRALVNAFSTFSTAPIDGPLDPLIDRLLDFVDEVFE